MAKPLLAKEKVEEAESIVERQSPLEVQLRSGPYTPNDRRFLLNRRKLARFM